MTPELIRYYEDRLTMFQSRGWKDLIFDVSEMLNATNRLDAVIPENLLFKKGELSMMTWLMNLEEMSKQAYADLHLSMPEGAPVLPNQDVGEPSDAG